MARTRTTKSGTKRSTTSGKAAAEPKRQAKTKAKATTAAAATTKSKPTKPSTKSATGTRTTRRAKNGHAANAGPTAGNGAAGLTHEQVAARAYELWLRSGCVPGRDEQNWREAEAQLRAEQPN